MAYKPVLFPQDKIHGILWTNPNTGAVYKYNYNKKSWMFESSSAQGGSITCSRTRPANPYGNDMWIDQTTYAIYVYDLREKQWIGLTNMGLTASV